jgi:hypothetical protein
VPLTPRSSIVAWNLFRLPVHTPPQGIRQARRWPKNRLDFNSLSLRNQRIAVIGAPKKASARVALCGIQTLVPLRNNPGLACFNELVAEFPFLQICSASGKQRLGHRLIAGSRRAVSRSNAMNKRQEPKVNAWTGGLPALVPSNDAP